MDEKTKATILDRLYRSSSICGFCGKKHCPHEGNLSLPDTLKTDDVLRAINLNGHYFKESNAVTDGGVLFGKLKF